jgi:hypothetical protein
MEKRCPKCKQIKPLDAFGRGTDRHGKACYCLACNMERNRAYQARKKREVRDGKDGD